MMMSHDRLFWTCRPCLYLAKTFDEADPIDKWPTQAALIEHTRQWHHDWLVALTPRKDQYPCACTPGKRKCWDRCPCNGRTVTATLPRNCCARSRSPRSAQ